MKVTSVIRRLVKTVAADYQYETRPDRPLTLVRVAQNASCNVESPVFVIGSPRSGTSFLGRAISRLKAASYHYEPIILGDLIAEIYRGGISEATARRLYRFVCYLLPRLHLDGDLNTVIKYPRNAFIVAWLATTFPGAKFIHIVRDGRDVALSLHEKGWLGDEHVRHDLPFWVSADERNEFLRASVIERCIWCWGRHVEAATQALAELDDSRTCTVKYEELCRQPREAWETIERNFVTWWGGQLDGESVASWLSRSASTHSIGRWRGELPERTLCSLAARERKMLEEWEYLPT